MFPFFLYLAHGYCQLEANVNHFVVLRLQDMHNALCVYSLFVQQRARNNTKPFVVAFHTFPPSSDLISLFLVHHVASSAFARIAR